MALLLREADVRNLVDIGDAIDALDFAFREWAAGRAQNQPRRRVTAGVTLAVLSAALPARNLVGYKAYTTGKSGARFWLHLFNATDGRPSAVIEADWLGALRTGAVSGLATRVLAPPEAATLTIFGAGRQALTQVLAVAAVRQITEIRIVNRSPERRAQFAAELRARFPDVRVIESLSARDGVQGAHVITTMTSSPTPLFDGEWVEAGQHLNAAGCNVSTRREMDARTVSRADLVVADDLEAASAEAGELLLAEQEGALDWGGIHSLRDVLTGSVTRSRASDITLFKSVGLALEDVALGAVIIDRARERGVGGRIDL